MLNKLKYILTSIFVYINGYSYEPITIIPPIPTQCISYTEYTGCYSKDLNRSVYTKEFLTADKLYKASGVKRKNTFHEDYYLKTHIKYNLIGSKYDRGHLAASSNMSTAKAQHESFSMLNIIPQHYSNNRGNWKRLENLQKEITENNGSLYVVSGTYGSNGNIKTSVIPKHVFKIFKNDYLEKVYVINNDGTQDINETNVSELSKASGYKFN